MTLLRRDRLRLLNARRTELLGLVSIFEQKSESEAFIEEIRGRIAEIEQHIADVECYRA